jgi:hypothetical protein
MRINQDDKLSIRSAMFPKTEVLLNTISTALPVKALRAGIDVITAINITKTKLPFALIGCGRNGTKIIPVIGNNKAKKSNEESAIDI